MQSTASEKQNSLMCSKQCTLTGNLSEVMSMAFGLAEELRLLLPVLNISWCTLGAAACCCVIQGIAKALVAAAGPEPRAGGTMPMVMGIIPGMAMADIGPGIMPAAGPCPWADGTMPMGIGIIPGIIPGIIGCMALPLPRLGDIMDMVWAFQASS